MISTAEAPSEICDEVPAVCRPSGSTGLRPASPSRVVSRSPWSASTTVSPVGAPRVETARDGDLALEPALVDRARAFCWEARPNASRSARVQAAVAGDPVGGLELVGHVDVPVVRARVARAGGCWRRAGPASSPRRRRRSRRRSRRRDHVVHQVGRLLGRAALGVDRGGAGVLRQPGVQPGPADMSLDCSPACVTHPPTTCSTSSGSTPARRGPHLGEAQQHRGVHAREPAVPLAEGRADGIDDHGVAHGQN